MFAYLQQQNQCTTHGADFICDDGFCQLSTRCTDDPFGDDDAATPGPGSNDDDTGEGPDDDATDDDATSDDTDDDTASDDSASDDTADDDSASEGADDDATSDDDMGTDDDGAVDDVPTDDDVSMGGPDGGPAGGAGGALDDGGSAGSSPDAGSGGSSGSDAGSALCDGQLCDQVRLPDCPSETTESCDGALCREGNAGTCVACPSGQICVQVDFSCGPGGGRSAQCVPDPCAGQALDCSCAADLCNVEGAALGCSALDQSDPTVGPDADPFLRCTGGGICASPDTLIATADGERRIADVRSGDLVYSQNAASVVLVPVLRVARTPVHDHSVVRLILDDGSTLEISGPHPTADGRRLSDLAPGDELDGRRVVTSEWIPYTHEFTFDILPASETGSYLANGVWLGTTLPR